MAPSCQRPVLRLLTSILFFYTVTTSVSALPQPEHQHCLQQRDSTQNSSAPVTLVPGDDTEDFFTELKKILNAFLGRLFGKENDNENGDGKGNVVHTIHVTMRPISTVFEATSSAGMMSKPGAVPSSASSATRFLGPMISGRPTAPWKNSTESTPTMVFPSTVSEILFSILPIYPIPKPNLGLNETTTTSPYATALPLSAFGPGFPVLSATDVTAWMAQSTTGFWSNSTKSGVARPTGTGISAPISTGIAEDQITTVLHLQSTKTVYITLPYDPSLWPNLGPPGATRGPANSTVTATLHRSFTRTRYITRTRTVTPIPIPMTASNTPPAITTITPQYPNTSSASPPNIPPTTATSPILIPFPFPPPQDLSPTTPNSLTRLCSAPDPKNAPLTLPLISLFYGPSAYPSLHPFPGCTTPNPSQLQRAPGLLNCTLLGTQVQTCQRLGRRILLGLRASSVTQVAGNLAYGGPGVPPQPYGPTYGPNATAPISPTPNLFDDMHTPSALALTLSSLFAETTTERADLRPLGPDGLADNGVDWLTKPLGEEVVLDGFDVQVPAEWRGTAQEGLFGEFVDRLNELSDEAWTESGATKGGSGDLGANGKGIVLMGWV